MSSSKAVFLEEKRRKMLVFGVNHQEKCSRRDKTVRSGAFSQYLWCWKARAVWFSLRENHAAFFHPTLHLL
jgi:hypothetical protein